MNDLSKSECLIRHTFHARRLIFPNILGVQGMWWAVMIIFATVIGGLILEVAAQGIQDPGDTDPIVPTARRTLFADQHALIAMPQDPVTQQAPITYTDWARSSDLESLELQEAFVPDLQGIQEARGASGHILNNETEQVAVGWFAGTGQENTIQVDILTPTGQIEADAVSSFSAFSISALFPDLPYPNSFDVATGNLSNLLDEDGVDHDEVVVCYFQKNSSVDENVRGQITVLDYTTLKDSGVVQTTAGFLAPGLFLEEDERYRSFGSDTATACAVGDLNGDGVDEIIKVGLSLPGAPNPFLPWSALVQVYQYINDGENDPVLKKVGADVTLPFVHNPRLPPPAPNIQFDRRLWVSVDVVTGDFNVMAAWILLSQPSRARC